MPHQRTVEDQRKSKCQPQHDGNLDHAKRQHILNALPKLVVGKGAHIIFQTDKGGPAHQPRAIDAGIECKNQRVYQKDDEPDQKRRQKEIGYSVCRIRRHWRLRFRCANETSVSADRAVVLLIDMLAAPRDGFVPYAIIESMLKGPNDPND